MRRLRPHLTYANVMSTLAVVLVVAGGTAYAANTVFSSDIANNEVYSADVRNDTLANGGLTATDLRSGSVGTAEIVNGGVRSPDVPNEALTGADIANQSGVDTCVASTIRLDQLCFRAEDSARNWGQAIGHCGSLGLRPPTYSEAVALISRHDLPNVAVDEFFWTQQRYQRSDGVNVATAVSEGGFSVTAELTAEVETVCVTTPTN